MRLHRPSHDFDRICRRALILLGCAALHAVQHVHLLLSAGMWVRCANRAEFFDAAPTLPSLERSAALNSSRNRNFVHMKGELNGVSPVFASVSGFVASVARPGGRRCWRRSLSPQATSGTTALQADAGRV